MSATHQAMSKPPAKISRKDAPRLSSPVFEHLSAKEAPVVQAKCACGGGCPRCQQESRDSDFQTKLAISTPGDQFEQEADRVAEQVMRMPDFESHPGHLQTSAMVQRRVVGNELSNSQGPTLQRAEASGEMPVSEGAAPKDGSNQEEGSRCPSWRADPQSISKRAAENYVQNDRTPPSKATVEKIDCEVPRANGNYGCYVHFSDGLVIRVIVREKDIVVGVPPINTMTPPPATPLCFYDYHCPDGLLVLTKRECKSAKPAAPSGPTLVGQRRAAPGASRSMDATPMMHSVLAAPGQPLDAATRGFFSTRFGHDFANVRVHADAEAAESARSVNALAYTVGKDVVFGTGQYSPGTHEGRRLLAHELTHVVQQSGSEGIRAGQSNEENGLSPISLPISPSSQPVVQRDEQAAGTGDEGRVLTVVIRAPDDKFTQNITDYVRNTLNDKNVIEVDNLQEVFPYLEKIKKSQGPKLRKIRLIAHGSTIGGIKMKLPGKGKREFVNPADLEKMAQDQNLQTIAAGAMEGDATVEFYGCYVGGEPTTEAAISTIFQSEFRSPDEALHTEEATFAWNGKTVTSSGSVDEAAKKDKKAKTQFEDWLLKQHKQLVAAGDIPDAGTKADKIAAMRDLFDRSKGRIKQLIIFTKGGEQVRPNQKDAWARQWRTWNVKGSSQ